jgi:nicotinate phosphoribosyltransferase
MSLLISYSHLVTIVKVNTMSIITSILDNDLYKFTMQKAVLEYKQNVSVEYLFQNRQTYRLFNQDFLNAFKLELKNMENLALQAGELEWLRHTLPWLGESYLQYLKNYRFDSSEIQSDLVDQQLSLTIRGDWERCILWEVPLLALISELFYIHCEKDWLLSDAQFESKIEKKREALKNMPFAEFGTRRRRSFKVQDRTIHALLSCPSFMGTSNVHFAHKFSIKPLGTMAHEWIMAVSALEGLRHSNRHAMRLWHTVYQGRLGTALADTYGTAAFFSDFDSSLARLFDGIRHDSGDPIAFANRAIQNYQQLGIDPLTKTIIFSDGLDLTKVAEIAKALSGKIGFSFGIGTYLSNDIPNSAPINIVIKMSKCDGVPVVKLSDEPSKRVGDKDALKVAEWTFFGKPL